MFDELATFSKVQKPAFLELLQGFIGKNNNKINYRFAKWWIVHWKKRIKQTSLTQKKRLSVTVF